MAMKRPFNKVLPLSRKVTVRFSGKSEVMTIFSGTFLSFRGTLTSISYSRSRVCSNQNKAAMSRKKRKVKTSLLLLLSKKSLILLIICQKRSFNASYFVWLLALASAAAAKIEFLSTHTFTLRSISSITSLSLISLITPWIPPAVITD